MKKKDNPRDNISKAARTGRGKTTQPAQAQPEAASRPHDCGPVRQPLFSADGPYDGPYSHA